MEINIKKEIAKKEEIKKEEVVIIIIIGTIMITIRKNNTMTMKMDKMIMIKK